MEVTDEREARRHWMGILAGAPVRMLEQAWEELGQKPEYRFLRRPETGLIMVRGRAGGSGKPFNLGEMTLTRCTVRIEGGKAGCAYVMGRNERHAELAAIFDALLQDPELRPILIDSLVSPLDSLFHDRNRQAALKTATSRVEFFTMVRGE